MNYVIITPVHNEERYIKSVLDAVTSQTLLPKEWIIVNDSSSDKTEDIVLTYAKDFQWIKLVTVRRSDGRAIGGNVIRAFNSGVEKIVNLNYDFIVKLDCDLTLPKNYFKSIAQVFAEEPTVGLCGGVCAVMKNGSLAIEYSADYHLRGAIKSYRRECFKDIGGLKAVMGWDAIDEMTAMYHGWRVKILKDLVVVHHRPTGNETGQIKFSFKMGRVCYGLRYGFLLALLRSIRRSILPPYFVGGLALLYGYLWALLRGEEKIVDEKLGRFIRRFQYSRILKVIQEPRKES